MASSQVIQAIIRAGRPSFRSNHDRLAYANHAFLLADGYKLVATGKDAEKAPKDIPDDASEVGTEGWQANRDGYAFAYTDTTGRRKPIVVKLVPMGNRLLLHWLPAGENTEPALLELNVDDYIEDGTDPSDVAAGFKDLPDLVAKLQSTFGRGAAAQQGAPPPPSGLRSGQPAFSAGPHVKRPAPASSNDPDLADDDLLKNGMPPFCRASAPARELMADHVPGVGPTGLTPPGFPAPGQGMPPFGTPSIGGMHVGPNDPLFHGPRGPFQGDPDRPGLADPFRPGFGAPGVGPSGRPGPPGGFPGGVPPGARWDPIRPPGMEGFRPADFQRGGRGRGMGDWQGVHPDIMPPGPGGGELFDDGFL